MKKILLFCFILAGTWTINAQQADVTCSPVKKGKVCYSDEVAVNNLSKERLFEIINKWAVKNYGSDVFFSNVSSNKGRGTILISSKVELLLSEKESTFVKFRMRIHCLDGKYTIDLTDIVYQYDPLNEKRIKTYPAENVILNEGKGNSVESIKNPLLFCEATHDYAEKLMGEVFDAVKRK